jgi:hypothetical protein
MDYLSRMFKNVFLIPKSDTTIVDEAKKFAAFENPKKRYNFIQIVTPVTTEDECSDVATEVESDDDSQWRREDQELKEIKEKLKQNQMMCNIL